MGSVVVCNLDQNGIGLFVAAAKGPVYLGGWLVGSVVVCVCDHCTGIDLSQIPGDWPRKFPSPMERKPNHCATPQSTARRFPGGKRILGNPPPPAVS